ncbi:MAG: class I tRNA ligase family protein [Candidatus Competibacteraceae bacterium]
MEGLALRHPFHDRGAPIILGDQRHHRSCTGAVHTAPAHGQEDYVVGSRYGLPVDNPVGPDGVPARYPRCSPACMCSPPTNG